MSKTAKAKGWTDRDTAQAAKMEFKPLMTKDQFMKMPEYLERARGFWEATLLAQTLLLCDDQEATNLMATLAEGTDDGGMASWEEMLDVVGDAREHYKACVELMEAARARLVIAMSRFTLAADKAPDAA